MDIQAFTEGNQSLLTRIPVLLLLYPCVCLLQLVPGETALAFYTASNPTDEPITGIATYNVIPFDAGQYFNKIQVNDRDIITVWVNNSSLLYIVIL